MGLGVKSSLGDSILTTKLDAAINWGRSYSLWPMAFGTLVVVLSLWQLLLLDMMFQDLELKL